MSQFQAHIDSVSTATISQALRILSEGMDSQDSVAEAALLHAAYRLDSLERDIEHLEKQLDVFASLNSSRLTGDFPPGVEDKCPFGDDIECKIYWRKWAEMTADHKSPKHDAGKIRLSLVPASLDYAVAAVREHGVKKYGDKENWRGVSRDRYFDALLRHVQAMRALGVDSVDSDSGLPHLWHVACNTAFLIELAEDK